MALYDDLKGTLSKGGYGTGMTSRDFQTRISAAEAQARSEGRPITGYRPLSYRYNLGRGNQGSATVNVPVFGKTEEETYAPLRAEQQRLAGIQQKLFESQQADITKQLKILQGEKSAISQMQQQYSDALLKEAEAKRKKLKNKQSKICKQLVLTQHWLIGLAFFRFVQHLVLHVPVVLKGLNVVPNSSEQLHLTKV